MTITHELKLDLKEKGELQRLNVVQGDAFSREVDVELLCGGEPWAIPVCDPVVRYLKPDGTAGIYDTMPDGSPAITYAGHVLTLKLAPQMLTCSGAVQVQVALNALDCRLATFAFLVVVEPDVALIGESEDYVSWTKAFLPQIGDAEEGSFLRIAEVDAAGRALRLEAAEDPTSELTARMDWMEDQFSGVAERAEDARLDAADAVRMASNAVPMPQEASVGQFLLVSQVDAQGRITALESADLIAAGGGNVHFMTQNFTLEEDVNTIEIQLPVPFRNFILYNCIIVRPETDKNTSPFTLYSRHGESYTKIGEVPVKGSINITSVRYGNSFTIQVTHRGDDAYDATEPCFGQGGTLSGNSFFRDGSSISYWDGVSGDNIFPAGTEVKFWMVYCE